MNFGYGSVAAPIGYGGYGSIAAPVMGGFGVSFPVACDMALDRVVGCVDRRKKSSVHVFH